MNKLIKSKLIKSIFYLFLGGMIFNMLGCVSYDFSKRVVTQGNLLPNDKIKRLKLGMSKEDVVVLMGQSLLEPSFNDNRWDYAYTYRKGSGSLLQKNIILYFNNNRLSKIENIN